MISRQQILNIAAKFPETAFDNPFENDFNTLVLRHKDTGKWFGLILRIPGYKIDSSHPTETDILNLKCDPLISFGLMQSFPAIHPAYHMNKHHWISIILDQGLPLEILEFLIQTSFDLTSKKISCHK